VIPVVGVAATTLSGEFLVSWRFLLIDVPLVGFFAGVAVASARAASAFAATARPNVRSEMTSSPSHPDDRRMRGWPNRPV